MKFVTTKKQAAIEASKNIGFGVLILIVAAIVNLFISRKIMQINRNISQNKQTVASLLLRGEVAQTAKTDLEYVGDNAQKIENAYVPANNISDYLGYLGNLSRQNAVQQTLHFSDPVPVSKQDDLSIDSVKYTQTLTNGNITKIVAYLRALERAPYVQKIDTLKINGSSDSGWNSAATAATFDSELFVKE